MSGSQLPPGPAEVWSSGDYIDVCDRMIPGLGARLVELAGAGAGQAVLDVACGTGNTALPAAGAGAAVTALDITPALLRAGAARSAAAELPVTWVQGDATALPFEATTFDRVLSCVGAQFCGDQEATAGELRRVCPCGPRGPGAPCGPCAPAGSCPARKSCASKEPSFTCAERTASALSWRAPTLCFGSTVFSAA